MGTRHTKRRAGYCNGTQTVSEVWRYVKAASCLRDNTSTSGSVVATTLLNLRAFSTLFGDRAAYLPLYNLDDGVVILDTTCFAVDRDSGYEPACLQVRKADIAK